MVVAALGVQPTGWDAGWVCLWVRWVPGCPLWSMELHAAYGATAGQQLDLVALSGGDVPLELSTSPWGWTFHQAAAGSQGSYPKI